MAAEAVFFGSVGTLAESTRLQRIAYNLAFAELELDWFWDEAAHRRLMRIPGARAQIAAHAERAGDRVDVPAVIDAHARYFARLVRRYGLLPRPGVVDIVQAATARRMRLAVCSTSEPAVVGVVMDALRRHGVSPQRFDFVGDATRCARPKPAPDIYAATVGRLDVDPGDVLAIEDRPAAAQAALDAGCRVLAFPSEMASGEEFQPGILAVDRLQPRLLDIGAAPIAARTAAE